MTGIRVALGARSLDIVRVVVGGSLVAVGIGVLAGIGLSLGVARLLASLLFGVTAGDAAVLGSVVVLLLLAATVASYWPARRAARVDPVSLLRAELTLRPPVTPAPEFDYRCAVVAVVCFRPTPVTRRRHSVNRQSSMILTAWLVHAFTASGALLAFLALRAATFGYVREAFLWLLLATLVDAADGWLARLARVKARLPHVDGARLDDIVDYLTFVFVPAWILDRTGALPPGAPGLVVIAAVLLSSAYGFSRSDAKTDDHFFTGFPSYWNIVAVYLVALDLGPALNAAVLLALAAAVFVPVGYVYPSRTPALQRTTVALGLLWGAMMLGVIWRLPMPPQRLVIGSLAFPVYYVALSLVLHGRRGRKGGAGTARD